MLLINTLDWELRWPPAGRSAVEPSSSTVALRATPAQTFTVDTAPINAWAAIVQVNAAIDVTYRLSIGLGYSGVLSGNARDHSGNLTFNLRF